MMTSTPYLMIDSRILDRVENSALRLGRVEKDAANPLPSVNHDGRILDEYPSWMRGYTDIIYDKDEQIYKRWCAGRYGTSKDGIQWEYPRIGLYEYEGSRDNNIVHIQEVGDAPLSGMCGVIKDEHDPDPARRYKGFQKMRRNSTAEDRRLMRHYRLWMNMVYSPDGIHWKEDLESEMPRWRGAHGDTHSSVLWDDRIQKWVLYTRMWDRDHKRVGTQGRRTVIRMESEDCCTWSFPQEVMSELPEEYWKRQVHDMGVMRYANQYLAVLNMQTQRTEEQAGNWEGELAWSPDGISWTRICPGCLPVPRGPEGSFDDGTQSLMYMPVILDDEVRFYYHASGSGGQGYGMGLARMKPNRFAGMAPVDSDKKALVVTRNLECTGRNLYVNADASKGALRVGVISHSRYDEEGIISPDECLPITTDVVDQRVEWKNDKSITALVHYPVRLYFELSGSTIYSFRFGD